MVWEPLTPARMVWERATLATEGSALAAGCGGRSRERCSLPQGLVRARGGSGWIGDCCTPGRRNRRMIPEPVARFRAACSEHDVPAGYRGTSPASSTTSSRIWPTISRPATG